MIQGLPSHPNFHRDWVRETEASRQPRLPTRRKAGEGPNPAPLSLGKSVHLDKTFQSVESVGARRRPSENRPTSTRYSKASRGRGEASYLFEMVRFRESIA